MIFERNDALKVFDSHHFLRLLGKNKFSRGGKSEFGVRYVKFYTLKKSKRIYQVVICLSCTSDERSELYP